MEIKCTVREFRELLNDTTKEEARERLKELCKKETPVAGTTDLLKKEQTESKSECSIGEDKSNCEYRRFNIEDLETRKKFESLFEKELITHEELVFIKSTIKLLLSNN